MSMWVSVPAMLVQAGLPKAQHWEIYLSAIVLSLIAMGALFSMERHGKLRAALLLSIGLVLAGQVGFGVLAASGATPSLWALGVTLFVFFCGFNVLEATQPSLASRMAPDNLRGAALGTYNTLQSIGLFLGGAVGGLLVKWGGATGLFIATSLITLAWLAWTWPLKPIARSARH
jgi:predicted MFS family arabinose efflux permease